MIRTRQAFSSDYYLKRQAEYESNARTYSRRLPIVIRNAQGMVVTDVDGRSYLDCLSGAGTLALGHNHPVAVDAIRRHIDSGCPMQALDFSTPVKDEFVTELFSTLPSDFARNARIQFCSPCGTDAVEAALKLVKTATGRSGIWASSGGFHGQTHGALALMGNLGPKRAVGGLMPGAHFVPFPYKYRCPLGKTVCGDCHCEDYIQNLVADPESGLLPPAGFITEVVQGEGGAIPATDNWLRAVRTITRDSGIPLIFDEVQTGWGRTGKMYAFEHAGVTPDVLILSKAIGGGMPLAVVVYHKALDVWNPGAHSGTFRGNQFAMAAGLATLGYIRSHDVLSNAAAMGQRFFERLALLKETHSFIGEIRGKGLMIGVELVDPRQTDRLGRPSGDPAMATRIQRECLKRGVILELGGRNGAVVRLLPPLIATAEQVDTVCNVLEAAFVVVAHTAGAAVV